MSTSTELETSSHILQLYPSHDGHHYYALAEKASRTDYIPVPLTEECKLLVDPIPSPDGNGHILTVNLRSKSIGHISSNAPNEIDQLAQFTAKWEDALNSIEQDSKATSSSFNPLATVTNSFATIPKLFSSSLPVVDTLDFKSDATTHNPDPTPNPTSHIVSQIYDAKDQFLVEKTITLRLATWNIHGESVQRVNLASLLGMPQRYDVYAIALQETDLSSPKNLSANILTLKSTENAIISTLGGPKSYKIVSSNQLLGILIILVASAEIAPQLSNPRIDTTGTGLLRIWGNKGAALIRVTLGGDSSINLPGLELSFLGCHLTAGEGKSGVDRRKWELAEIEAKLCVPWLSSIKPKTIIEGDDIEDGETDDLPPSNESVVSSIAFVLGDLNYRVALDPAVVSDFVINKEYETILIYDQLSQEAKNNHIFTGFKESSIDFAPTYKYSIGTDKFDCSPLSNTSKPRVPSYTDRILYTPSALIKPIDYLSVMEYSISDHKPVCASFELVASLVDSEKRKAVMQEVLRKSDSIENSLRPSILVEPRELTVSGKVLETAEGELFIQQQPLLPSQHGGVVQWELTIDSPHVSVHPISGTLPVGAKQYVHFSCELEVKVGEENSKILAVAVLHVRNVQDIFIPIEFNALPSCLGKSLDVLTQMPKGANSQTIDHDSSTNMPREIWNCVDYLWAHAFPDMFDEKLSKPEKSIQLQIQDWMDNGQDFDYEVLNTANTVQRNSGVYSVAQQFLFLLKYINGGIIPAEHYPVVLRGREGVLTVSCRVAQLGGDLLIS